MRALLVLLLIFNLLDANAGDISLSIIVHDGPGHQSTSATINAIAAKQTYCASLPTQGTVYYYCDCGNGAATGCIAGDDANPGTSASSPRRTITKAITQLNSLSGGNTIALCQGGAFNATGQLSMDPPRCAAGTTCNDLREYVTSWGANKKPIINNATGGVRLFSFMGNVGGVRILNLKLNGDNGAVGNGNTAFFFYKGAHDVTMCNNTLTNFDGAIYNAGGNPIPVATTTNIKLTGNTITNSRSQGFLGSGQNAEISYNYWEGNGSSNNRDHTIYLSAHQPVSNVKVISNYIHGQYGATCLGAPIVAHGEFTGLNILDNTVAIDATAAEGGCWGISLSNGGYPVAVYFRNAVIAGNTLINTGNTSLTVAECPGCVIKNNLIVQDWTYGPGYYVIGIFSGQEAHRTGDDENSQNQITNNTIWFGPTSNGGATGVIVGTEGSGHITANNTVNYTATSSKQGVNCFSYTLLLGSVPPPYSFINNNHCNSKSSFKWEANRGSLKEWKSTSGFDLFSFTGDPKFTTEDGTNFIPTGTSPLINAGDVTHGSANDLNGKLRTTNPKSKPAIGAFESGER